MSKPTKQETEEVQAIAEKFGFTLLKPSVAAAEAGECSPQRHIMLKTIERCAQIVDKWPRGQNLLYLATAIRALKDKP